MTLRHSRHRVPINREQRGGETGWIERRGDRANEKNAAVFRAAEGNVSSGNVEKRSAANNNSDRVSEARDVSFFRDIICFTSFYDGPYLLRNVTERRATSLLLILLPLDG